MHGRPCRQWTGRHLYLTTGFDRGKGGRCRPLGLVRAHAGPYSGRKVIGVVWKERDHVAATASESPRFTNGRHRAPEVIQARPAGERILKRRPDYFSAAALSSSLRPSAGASCAVRTDCLRAGFHMCHWLLMLRIFRSFGVNLLRNLSIKDCSL